MTTTFADLDHPAVAAIHERCDVLPVSKETDEDAWLAERRKGLGGSDIGAALGLNPYTSPTKLWLEKTGQIPPDDLSDNESVEWGNRLEDLVADKFAETTGYQVIKPDCMFVVRDQPILRISPDRLYIDDDGELGVLECKTGDWRTSEHWAKDSSPPWYEAQTGYYVAVLGLTESRIACLLGGNRFLPRDPAFTPPILDALIDRAVQWWDRHVIGGEPPVIDSSDATTKALNAMWETVDGVYDLDDDALALVRDFARAHALQKEAKDEKDRLGNELRALLADYEVGAYDGTPLFTNKVINTTTIDWEGLAHDLAGLLGVDDVLDLVTDNHRTRGSYRRLNLGRSKAAKAILTPTPEGT